MEKEITMETVLYTSSMSGTKVVYILDDMDKAKDFIKQSVVDRIRYEKEHGGHVMGNDLIEKHSFDWTFGVVRIQCGLLNYESYSWQVIENIDKREGE